MLKSLELFGFKSFADRTLLEFDPGITAVIGPNGSGKSNVVDAIKWILGDQSPKSLRGKEMADVIFNGSGSRKGSSFAEAILTFDNSHGFLPDDRVEVSVGRRLWKGGDAEYLINGQTARLRDVRDLFMGTGAGRSAYAIIEQGRVAQILQSNATNRRLVFEEAAGISRFKSRKIEAERKLERVDTNLERLIDIVDGLDSQLHSLRSQAEKAASYRDLSKELKQWWQGLAADDFRHLSEQIEQHNLAIQEAAVKRNFLQDDSQRLSSQIEHEDHKILETEQALRELEQEGLKNREQIALHQGSVQQHTRLEQQFDEEMSGLEAQLSILQGRTLESIREREHLEKMLETNSILHHEKKSELDQVQELGYTLVDEIQSQRQQMEDVRGKLLEQMKQFSQSELSLARYQEEESDLQQQIEQTQQELKTHSVRLQKQQAMMDALEEEVHQARQSLGRIEEDIEEHQQNHTWLRANYDDLQQQLSIWKERSSAHQARVNLLEDLETRMEGWSYGVREILRRSHQCDYPPWNRILGTVFELLHVDLEHAAVIEVALGPRAHLIVIQEFDSLLEYLESATAHIKGRVGFLSISPDLKHYRALVPDDAIPDENFEQLIRKPLSLPNLSRHPDVLGRADAFVSSPQKFPQLGELLLADTWIVNDLETARILSLETANFCRFVTLQGELWEQGRLYVGSFRSEPTPISRRMELRTLRQELKTLKENLAREEQSYLRLEQKLQDSLKQRTLNEKRKNDAFQQLQEIWNRYQEEQRQQKRLQEEAEILSARLTHQKEQCDDRKQSHSHILQEHQNLNTTLQGLQQQISEHEKHIQEKESQLKTFHQNHQSEQLEVVKQQERLDAMKLSVKRLEEELHQRQSQEDEAKRRWNVLQERKRKTVLTCLNVQNELSEKYLEKDRFQLQIASLQSQLGMLKQNRHRSQQERSRCQEELQRIETERHQEEILLREHQHHLNHLTERMEEEYQQPIQTIVDSGVSALQLVASQEHEHQSELAEFMESNEESDSVENSNTEINSTTNLSGTEDSASPRNIQHWDESKKQAVREEVDSKIQRLRRKLKRLGNVNTESLHGLEELEDRFDRLNAQLQDLLEAKQILQDIIRKIDMESIRLFEESFDSIRENFQILFRKLFGGGEGDILLEDRSDILDCGIEIVARPPGKELRSISLLSGGEKTMTAVALLMAIFKSKPSPFCILDEVDAALDEANIDRFVGVLREFLSTTQFIMITHRKPSMTVADVIYGVTMEESGISKRMSVKFEEIDEDGNFKSSSGGSSSTLRAA